MDDTDRDRLGHRRLAEAVVDKTWRIPAHEGMGPVTMTLRLPEVKITDSEGRFIVVSPRQSGLMGMRMAAIHEWLTYGDEDHPPIELDDPA